MEDDLHRRSINTKYNSLLINQNEKNRKDLCTVWNLLPQQAFQGIYKSLCWLPSFFEYGSQSVYDSYVKLLTMKRAHIGENS